MESRQGRPGGRPCRFWDNPLQCAAGTDDTLVNPTMIVEVLSDTTEAYDLAEVYAGVEFAASSLRPPPPR